MQCSLQCLHHLAAVVFNKDPIVPWLNVSFGSSMQCGLQCLHHLFDWLTDWESAGVYAVCLQCFSYKSIVVVADQSVISWGSFPSYGELVSGAAVHRLLVTFGTVSSLGNWQLLAMPNVISPPVKGAGENWISLFLSLCSCHCFDKCPPPAHRFQNYNHKSLVSLFSCVLRVHFQYEIK